MSGASRSQLIARRLLDRTAQFAANELTNLPVLHVRDGWRVMLVVHHPETTEVVAFQPTELMVRVYSTPRSFDVQGWRLIEEYGAGR